MQLVDHTIWTGERETNNSTSIRKTSGKKIKKKNEKGKSTVFKIADTAVHNDRTVKICEK